MRCKEATHQTDRLSMTDVMLVLVYQSRCCCFVGTLLFCRILGGSFRQRHPKKAAHSTDSSKKKPSYSSYLKFVTTVEEALRYSAS